MNNPFSKARIFFAEMIGELQKATWPTRTELRDSTVIVIVAAIVMGIFISISDFALLQVIDLLSDFARPPGPGA